jgi:hypothetical protein
VSLTSIRDLEERLRADPAASAESPEVSYDNFRPNIVIDGPSLTPYAEESWSGISIASPDLSIRIDLKAIGHCNRCSMICVDKNTGQIKREPLRTLASYRRDNVRRCTIQFYRNDLIAFSSHFRAVFHLAYCSLKMQVSPITPTCSCKSGRSSQLLENDICVP